MNARSWLTVRERGSVGALRFALWLLRRLGRRGMRPILYPITLYFFLTGAAARRASRAYLERVAAHPEGRAALGGEPSWRHGVRHLFCFVENTLDRVALFAGRAGDLEIVIHGREHLAAQRGRGAILLGAHLGSFDLLRAAADDHSIPVNVVMYTANAQLINDFLYELDPSSRVNVIGIEPGAANAGFAVKACLDRGEFVAVLADRVGLDRRERSHRVDFLGSQAAFPEGPFLLSLVLEAPVCLLFALKTGPRRYEIFAEPQVGDARDGRAAPNGPARRVPRGERVKVLEERIQHYAARLEHYCLRYPYQWFNFYDFWAPTEADSQPGAATTQDPGAAK